MQRESVFYTFFGAALASVVIASGFILFTFELSESYLTEVGPLVHPDAKINRALLFLLSQACAIGGAGGYLFVLEIIFNLVHKCEDWFSSQTTKWERFLIGFLIPFRGVIAGALVSGISGGLVFIVGGIEALGHSHLIILGISLVTGYSDEVLKKIIQLGSSRADQL